MQRTFAALLLAASACGNSDNVIIGGAAGGATTPDVLFDSIGSSIHGTATLSDPDGNPQGAPVVVVIMSNQPNLCARLKAKPDYFRKPTEAYEALILFVPADNPCQPGAGIRLGTFFVGRLCDQGTDAEIVAVSGPQEVTPFLAVPGSGSYVALTNWPANNGNATGSFNVLFDDPYGSSLPDQFYGRFKTTPCPTLEGTLLP